MRTAYLSHSGICWNHSKTKSWNPHLLTCLVLDTGCRLGPYLETSATTPAHGISIQCGFLRTWYQIQGRVSLDRKPDKQCHFLQFSIKSHATACPLRSIFHSTHVGSPNFQRNGSGFHFWVTDCQSSGRSHQNRNAAVAILGKYNMLQSPSFVIIICILPTCKMHFHEFFVLFF